MTGDAGRVAALVVVLLVLAACGPSGAGGPPRAADGAGSSSTAARPTTAGPTAPSSAPARVPAPAPFRHLLPGMPPIERGDLAGATESGTLSPRVRRDPAMVYVPDSSPTGSTVTVISQRTHRVVRTLRVGPLTQHVVPSYDLRRLYATSSLSNQLFVIDPRRVRVVRSVPVPRPYNLYYTPDGTRSVVMEEQHDEIRFSDPRTFRARRIVSTPGCRGPNHADFSANGRVMVVTCEFSGLLLKLSTVGERVLGRLKLPAGSKPQDVRLSPDGRTYYVADLVANEVRLIDARRFRQVGAIRTPAGPHGLYPSRDGRLLYVTDRTAGAVSVVSYRTRRVVDTWRIPNGTPDMGGLSADGRTLWLSGRYGAEVYALDTRTGRLLARVPVPGSPHGMSVWPQPGRYSLGHTGNMR